MQSMTMMKAKTKEMRSVLRALAVVLSGAVLLARVIPAQAAVSVNIAYSPASQTIAQNGTVAMAIQATGSQQVQGIQLRVTFDATKLQYQSISYGTAFDYTDPAAGLGGSGAGSYFQINQAKLGVAPTPPFTVATITFRALTSSGSTTVGYDSANSVAYDTAAASSPINSLSTATYSFRDGTNPSVSISAPANGATVSGNTTFSATASDDSGTVSRVEFYVDGALKATDTAAPYSTAVDTAALSNASHSFMARAYDAAGNSANATVSATVRNATAGGGSTPGSTPKTSGSSSPASSAAGSGSSAPNNSATAQQASSTVPAGNGVQTVASPFAVASLKDTKAKKSNTRTMFAIVGVSVATIGAVAAGIIMRNIILRQRELRRHIAVLPSSATPYEPHQQPIAPTNLPSGSRVIQPTEHHDDQIGS